MTGQAQRITSHRAPAAVLVSAAFVTFLALPNQSGAQDLFPRADADCNYRLNAADLVAALRALNDESTCANDDCDRDGELTGADVDCAARCLFGECAVPPHGPRIGAIAPELGQGIAPFATIRITGTNFAADERLTQVTIGGVSAEVVGVVSPQEILVVVPPLAPGPMQVAVRTGEIDGFVLPIEVAAQAPIAEPDTLEGTFALLETVSERFAALDLESAFGEDAEALREALQTFRDDVAEQRLALSTDPALTPELRAQLDAAFDSSGVPDALRDVQAEIEALIDGAASGPNAVRPRGTLAVANAARRLRDTIAVARGVVAVAGGAASAPVGLIALGTGVLAGALTLAGSAALPPILTAATFVDRMGQVSAEIRPQGRIVVRGRRLVGTNLVIRTAVGELVIEPEQSGDDFRQFRLFESYGLCGIVELFLRRVLPGESQRIRGQVQPELLSFYGTTRARPGETLFMETVGVAGCKGQARFSGPGAGPFDFFRTTITAESSRTVFAVVPSVPTDPYQVRISVGVSETEPLNLQIDNPLSLEVRCVLLALNMEPAQPSRTTCTAVLRPERIPPPDGSAFIWGLTDPGTAVIEGGGSQVTVVAAHPGSTAVTSQLKLRQRVITEGQSRAIVVSDRTAPGVLLNGPAQGDVPPGSSLVLTVSASDNEVVSRLVLHAVGDAVLNPEQEFPCTALETTCDANFSVNLKQDGFDNAEVTIDAEAFDGAGNRGVSRLRTYMVKAPADTACPVVRIDSPSGGTVNAGMDVQVMAHANDDRDNDTGVKRFRYSASGDALVAPVAQELPFPTALPSADLRFTFTVRMAADLLQVANRTIVISVEAIDDAGNTCGAVTSSVSVIGVLDACQGSITTDNPSGYIDEPFTITATISGDVASQITRVTSINPGGQFDLTPRGNGVYTVTLFYQGTGSFTLTFYAYDADGNQRCSGAIGLEALGPAP